MITERKIVVKYLLSNNDWVENNYYSFIFDPMKCVHIMDNNNDWLDNRGELMKYDGLEIFANFQGYSIDERSIWVVDLLQLKRDSILNKILSK